MSPDIKRRIVFTVLSDYVNGDELKAVLLLWQQEFAERSRYELNQFLGACRDVPAIQQNRVEILSRLVRMIMKPDESGLKPDPIHWMSSQATQKQTPTPESSAQPDGYAPQNVLVTDIVNVMFSRLRSDHVRSIKSYVVSVATRKKLQGPALAMFEQPDISIPRVHAPLEIQEACKLINFTYIGCCEAVGPVETDLLFSKASREVGEKYHGNAAFTECLNKLLGR
ncbi:hypothetical protein [Thalassolituus sp.]|uniref:hypothetical protein n=1 Tax=Thalassolituus sp. TaxID=2030822 RepID=UPI003515CA39